MLVITGNIMVKIMENLFHVELVDGWLVTKTFFWSFVAGFNQKYVVDIINSVKTKP